MKAWTTCALLLSLIAAPLAWAQDAPTALRVTYLVYSGRPNPTLTITAPATIRSLQSQLSSALATGAGVKSKELPSVLGYNGIRVEVIGKDDAPQYTVKGHFLRSETQVDGKANAAVAASSSTSASLVEAQLLKLAENQGLLSAAALANARREASK